jgi:hypothetical protein
MADLLPTETAYYRTQQNRIDRTADLSRQQNRYDQSVWQAQSGWERADLIDRLARQRSSLPSSFTKRGMMNSGLWQNQLKDFVGQRSQALNRFDQAANLKKYGFAMTNNQLGTVQQGSTDDLNAQIAALRQMRSSTLGGY